MTRNPEPVAAAGTFNTREPSLYELAIKPWELTVDLRSSKAFECEIDFLKLDGITIYRDRYGSKMRLQGTTPPGVLTLALPIDGLDDSSAFWGKKIEKRGLYYSFYDELDSVTAAGHDQLIILINTEDSYGADFHDILNLFDGRPSRQAVLQSDTSVLQHQCQSLLHAASRIGALQDPALGCAMREELVTSIRHQLLRAHREERLPIGRKETSAISKMFDFVASSAEPALSVHQLCNAAGVNERTLERAVRAKFDCTVQDLLRRRRFHEARRKLLFADPGATTVTRISYELGFYDGGRFAKDYLSFFGEFPSQTLKSPPVERVGPLLER